MVPIVFTVLSQGTKRDWAPQPPTPLLLSSTPCPHALHREACRSVRERQESFVIKWVFVFISQKWRWKFCVQLLRKEKKIPTLKMSIQCLWQSVPDTVNNQRNLFCGMSCLLHVCPAAGVSKRFSWGTGVWLHSLLNAGSLHAKTLPGVWPVYVEQAAKHLEI